MQSDDILVNALGGVVRVRLDNSGRPLDEARLRALQDPWADAQPPHRDLEAPGVDVFELSWPFPDEADLVRSVADLSTHATLAAIEGRRGQLLMLHAAGVADEKGRVLAFIGPSGRGKTTLARTLGQQFSYVTDETVGIESDGSVHSYRKPLSIIRAGEDHKEQVAPSLLGLKELPDAELRLGGLVLVSRVPDLQGRPEIAQLELCEALAAIVPEVSYLADLDQPLQMIARLVDRCGAIRQVTYREASDVPPLVPELLTAAAPEPWEAVLPVQDPVGAHSALNEERYVPAPVLDAVESAGQTAIIDTSRVVHILDGVGPVIWRSLCAGRDFDGVAHDVETVFGVPPERSLEAAVSQVLRALADAGLLQRFPDHVA
ncbi:PqqD family protein [Arthrobacter woluwensis]|uniref:PqqD family protein n=1 Tax=Arthrobacter woluwensis TaxID=156980 RepID=UPI0011AAE831|nr:PqqD family protein [Arthrobacter woluwensis]